MSTAAQPEGSRRCLHSSQQRACPAWPSWPLCSADGPGPVASLSSLSLSGTRSPCLSPDGSVYLPLRAWAKGRSGRHLEGGQGVPTPGSSNSSKLCLLGAHPLAHRTRLPASTPAPASRSRIQPPPGAADNQGALPPWGSHRLFSDFDHMPASLIGCSPPPSYVFPRPGQAGNCLQRPSIF